MLKVSFYYLLVPCGVCGIDVLHDNEEAILFVIKPDEEVVEDEDNDDSVTNIESHKKRPKENDMIVVKDDLRNSV